jgi:hypothetical protein
MTTNTLFSDVSEFNDPVKDGYPYKFLAIRSNDGTYRDKHFAQNLAWAKAATDAGHLVGFAVYFVFEENWQATFETFKSQVGVPHEKMAVFIDIESWGGRIRGDHSTQLNALRAAVLQWLRSFRSKIAWTVDIVFGRQVRRVAAYGNSADLNNLWPKRGSIAVGLAAYGSNPQFPGKLFHQFTDRANTAPFGRPTDLNSADGLTPAQFAGKLGLLSTTEAVAQLVARVRGKR